MTALRGEIFEVGMHICCCGRHPQAAAGVAARGRVGRLLIGRSLIQSPDPVECMLKDPWARC